MDRVLEEAEWEKRVVGYMIPASMERTTQRRWDYLLYPLQYIWVSLVKSVSLYIF